MIGIFNMGASCVCCFGVFDFPSLMVLGVLKYPCACFAGFGAFLAQLSLEAAYPLCYLYAWPGGFHAKSPAGEDLLVA